MNEADAKTISEVFNREFAGRSIGVTVKKETRRDVLSASRLRLLSSLPDFDPDEIIYSYRIQENDPLLGTIENKIMLSLKISGLAAFVSDQSATTYGMCPDRASPQDILKMNVVEDREKPGQWVIDEFSIVV